MTTQKRDDFADAPAFRQMLKGRRVVVYPASHWIDPFERPVATGRFEVRSSSASANVEFGD